MERRPDQIKRLRSQAITLENREMLTVSGVRNVADFNETDISLDTDCGMLHIDGDALHITKLNLDDGIVSVEGTVCGVVFEDEPEERGNIFTRLFK